MWTYLLGPIIALLPKPWRRALPFEAEVEWGKATAISGFAEIVVSIIGLMHWYATSMST